jgi:hypothetical protein
MQTTDSQGEKFTTANSIGERIMAIIRHYHLNKNSFSLKIGLTNNSYVIRVVNNPEVGISLGLIQKTLTTFTDINPEWFVLGEGEMFRNKRYPDPSLHYIKYSKEVGGKPVDLFRIHGFDDCDVAFDVIGSGMAPKYRPGDIIICKEEEVGNILQYGEAFLIICDGKPLIRYIKSKISDHRFKLGAEDLRYEDSTIDLKDIQHLYLIKGLVRKEVF